MKENTTNTASADADFDARCKALLEQRAVPAPKPRADMFARDTRGWGRSMFGFAAAAILIGAIVSLNMDDTIGPVQGGEITLPIIQDEGVKMEGGESASTAFPTQQEAVSADASGETADAPVTTVQTEGDPSSSISTTETMAPQAAASIEPKSRTGSDDADAIGSSTSPLESQETVGSDRLNVAQVEQESGGREAAVDSPDHGDASVPAGSPDHMEPTPIDEPSPDGEGDAPSLTLPLTVRPGGGGR